ncbi:unnamed protein product [Adineta steineri]|uniref:NHL repeat containing protein-like protein n=1 Tax=Adineta steineri TaxID=433720 RepID=A0A814MWT7_9BILA|nr:unnamed protein product [Adineta steineri]
METDETARKTLSLKISSQRSYFIIILVCSLASYAVLRRTNNCSLAATWTACKTFHLPDYLKKLSNSSVLEHFTDVNSIPGTTGPGIPTVIRLALSTKYGGVNTNATSSYGAAAGVIVDHLGQIYVADCFNHRVMRWCEGNTEGEIVVGGNDDGKELNQLNGPKGLSFDDEENLYVVDNGNHRILKFEKCFN